MTTNVNSPSISEQFQLRNSYRDVSGVCPHCGSFSTFQGRSDAPVTPGHHDPKAKRETYIIIQMASCPACNGLVIGACEFDDLQCRKLRASTHLWPLPIWPDHAPDDIDPEIKKYYYESRGILPLSPAGSAVLARRCLQHVIRKRLGITKATLFHEIDAAVERPELSQPTKESLHDVRQIGNWAAHPTLDQAAALMDVTKEEAEYTLEALEMVFEDLYVSTARASSMKKKIAERKSGSVATT